MKVREVEEGLFSSTVRTYGRIYHQCEYVEMVIEYFAGRWMDGWIERSDGWTTYIQIDGSVQISTKNFSFHLFLIAALAMNYEILK